MTDNTIIVPCHLRTVRGATEPKVFIKNGGVFANSEDVSAYFGKQHFHVIRSINTLISQDKKCASNFGFTFRDIEMPMGGARKTKTYDMNRDGFTLLAMGFTGKRALAWKLKYIEAFNAMENSIAQPQPMYPDERPTGVPVDGVDVGLDLLLTAETALYAEGAIDPDIIAAVRSTIEQARKLLAPVRAHLDAA